MKMLVFSVGSIVDLFGEKCKVVRIHPAADGNHQYDLESLELQDEEGQPAFYGRIAGETLG